jgi:hypothetical protein
MHHPDKTLANIRLKKQMKHSENTLEIYVYSHCNMCNIPIYFCNIKMKYLQHLDETLETCVCNIDFQRSVILLLRRMEACRCGARCWRGGRCWRMELVVRQRRGQLADGTASHEAHPPCVLVGASVVEARRLGGGGQK